MQHQEIFKKRRTRFFDKMEDSAIAVFPAASLQPRTNEEEYPFRQNGDFYYLTGFSEPDALAVLVKKEGVCCYILFNLKRDLSIEQWVGFRCGQKGAVQEYWADEAYPLDELESRILDLLRGHETLYYAFSANTAFDARMSRWLSTVQQNKRAGILTPGKIIHPSRILHEMRLIKDDFELKLLEQAAAIDIAAFKRALLACKSGMFEYELEAELKYEYCRNNARSESFPTIVASGENGCILHYVKNDSKIKEGDLVLIDAGCEFENYASDMTRTFPANGRFTDEQRAIYEIVLNAQEAAISKMQPGISWIEPNTAAIRVITQGLCDLGILKGDVEQLIQDKAYFACYMHSVTHFIGLEVHDVGEYQKGGAWRTFEAGMVLSAEPGIYILPGMKDVDEKWWGIGVRIEDEVLITQEGNRILTHDMPKTVNEIEGFLAK